MVGTRGFTVREAARLAEVPEGLVNYWSGPRGKVLVPELAHAGRGSRKLFSERDLVRLRVVHLLAGRRWIPLRTLRAAMAVPKGLDWFNPYAGERWIELLVCRGTRDWELRSCGRHEETGFPTKLLEELWTEDLEPNEDVIVVNLTAVKEHIRKHL